MKGWPAAGACGGASSRRRRQWQIGGRRCSLTGAATVAIYSRGACRASHFMGKHPRCINARGTATASACVRGKRGRRCSERVHAAWRAVLRPRRLLEVHARLTHVELTHRLRRSALVRRRTAATRGRARA
jgi:hypothetical protein